MINKNGKPKRIVPRSYEEWGKLVLFRCRYSSIETERFFRLDQKLSKEMDGDNDDDDKDDHGTRKPSLLTEVFSK